MMNTWFRTAAIRLIMLLGSHVLYPGREQGGQPAVPP